MSQVLNLLRSVLFFTLIGLSFHSMSDQAAISIPHEAILKYKLSRVALYTEAPVEFRYSLDEPQLRITRESVQKVKPPQRQPSSVSRLVVHNDLEDVPFTELKQKSNLEKRRKARDLCAVAKKNKSLDFKTPTSYLSSILRKAGSVDSKKSLFQDHADLFWSEYLSQNNFEDVSVEYKKKSKFSFEQLERGSLIVLEKSCFGKGTVALYCDGQYYATRFVKTDRLLKKINTEGHKCQLGKGMRIVVEKRERRDSFQSIAWNL